MTGRTAAQEALGDPVAGRRSDLAGVDAADDPWVSGEPPAVAWPAAVSGESAKAERRAFVCFCEDVRVGEILAERRAGYGDPELVKRRTACLTGPCQGKYCLPAFVNAVQPGDPAGIAMPTGRPPLRPVRLGELAAERSDEP